MANLSFGIVETFLILSSVVHSVEFWAFFDADKTLPSSEPIRSSSDENESDVWPGKLCCLERSGTSACIAERSLNPVTPVEDSVNRWLGSSATETRRQVELEELGYCFALEKFNLNSSSSSFVIHFNLLHF